MKWINGRCTINFYWFQQQELQNLIYYSIVQNSYIKYICLWETSKFSKLVLQIATSYIFNTKHWTSTQKQPWLENPEPDQLTEQFVVTQLLTSQHFTILLQYTQLLHEMWSHVVLRHEQDQEVGKYWREVKKEKALSSPKGCKLSALCPHKRQNRKKGGWMEKHTKKKDKSDISFASMHGHEVWGTSHAMSPLYAADTHTWNHAATLLQQSTEINRSIINLTCFGCLPRSNCVFPVTNYGCLTLKSITPVQSSELNYRVPLRSTTITSSFASELNFLGKPVSSNKPQSAQIIVSIFLHSDFMLNHTCYSKPKEFTEKCFCRLQNKSIFKMRV